LKILVQIIQKLMLLKVYNVQRKQSRSSCKTYLKIVKKRS